MFFIFYHPLYPRAEFFGIFHFSFLILILVPFIFSYLKISSNF